MSKRELEYFEIVNLLLTIIVSLAGLFMLGAFIWSAIFGQPEAQIILGIVIFIYLVFLFLKRKLENE